MTESSLTSAFVQEARDRLPGAVILKHSDRVTSGIPDISITMNGRTSWLECKYAVPGFKSNGLQELTMLRLSASGLARYIIWEEKRGIRRTMIVHPKHLHDLMPEAFCVGFDRRWLVEQIRGMHA